MFSFPTNKLFYSLSLIAFMSYSAQAVILDEEPVKPAVRPEPKVNKSNALEKENQRIKQELEAMKKAKQEDEQAKQEQIKQQKEAEFQRMKQELEGLQEQQNQVKQRADEAEKAKAQEKSLANSKENYELAYKALSEGRYDIAIKLFESYISDFPSGEYIVNAQYWLAETFKVNKNVDRAKQEFNKLITTYPNSQKVGDALLKLGYIEFDLKNFEKSKEYLTRASTYYPNSVAAHLAGKKLAELP